jgi:hypothetical protein
MMELGGTGGEWLEVKRFGAGETAVWRVDARLGGNHYKVGESFDSSDAARGGALLLAVRLLAPARREPLLTALHAIPGAFWWRIAPTHDGDGERRAIFSSRTAATADAAERAGRAAGAGWWLWVHGPGSTRDCGLVPSGRTRGGGP